MLSLLIFLMQMNQMNYKQLLLTEPATQLQQNSLLIRAPTTSNGWLQEASSRTKNVLAFGRGNSNKNQKQSPLVNEKIILPSRVSTKCSE